MPSRDRRDGVDAEERITLDRRSAAMNPGLMSGRAPTALSLSVPVVSSITQIPLNVSQISSMRSRNRCSWNVPYI